MINCAEQSAPWHRQVQSDTFSWGDGLGTVRRQDRELVCDGVSIMVPFEAIGDGEKTAMTAVANVVWGAGATGVQQKCMSS